MVYSIYMTYDNLCIKGLGNRVFWVLFDSSLLSLRGTSMSAPWKLRVGPG